MGAIAANLARAGNEAQQLELELQRTADGHAMVSAHGELDIATAEQALAYLRRILDGEKKGKVILNLADLTFCDAAGLGVLAKAANHARSTGRTLRVTAASPSLVRIMLITGMDEAFPEIRTPVLAVSCPSQFTPRAAGQASARNPRTDTVSPS
jgi:anti-sigma B factor antagonist